MNELTAEGFMKSLPPRGWDDLATKSDLAALETKIETLGTVLEATFTAKLATEIGDVRGGMRGQTITLIVTIVVAFLGQGAMARYLPLPQPPGPSGHHPVVRRVAG